MDGNDEIKAGQDRGEAGNENAHGGSNDMGIYAMRTERCVVNVQPVSTPPKIII
jgi:hypothetical protein